MTQQLFAQDDIICDYTRKQAILDGEQILLENSLARLTKEAGYKYPVYLTRSVWTLVEMAINNKKHCNDLEGVIWDILYMSIKASRAIDPCTSRFEVIVTGAGNKKYHQMIAQCGPTDIDNPAPAITIMLPEDN